ncbi:type II toxin-antitoxin system RelE/ParE family toxin [Antarcticibacterium sp. 1MA-6-2]|uniref:type II toxin-antitoxin system RelE/ParE family toxin n=1 Tax=Antarcticibacterium sp. 1MA-6-2 TaxID=2908210 RepID=UPI001F42C1F0|nr:type II toxin-antitoxin system RelE/ParE family toxin [Antarcticibacterium sp. 1MA-6-2]UJH92214.1 type II toxin-antitoxin system RelE/ParE family toxin [Antarcticibacterium sp. 1MA-6-2]
MAGRIKWSKKATEDLQEILAYWRSRNKSNTYSKKLYKEIIQIIYLLDAYPYLGISTSDKFIRVKIFKSYKFFYEFKSKPITILGIWDTRQDPEELETL